MTSSPPETETEETGEGDAEEGAPHPLAEYAERVAQVVDGSAVVTFDTVKVTVPPERWVATLTAARDELDLISFSFLSAIDWANQVEVGSPLEQELEEESIEILATVGDLSEGRRVTFSTSLPHDEPVVDSLVDVYAGANWHEREAHEMFGIDFLGHPDLSKLYLPEHFLGNPLRKSFPLLSREVKPWPGTVDVEDMPQAAEEDGSTDEDAAGEATPAGEDAAGEATPAGEEPSSEDVDGGTEEEA